MRRIGLTGLVTAIALAVAAPAAGQSPPGLEDPEAAIVEELVVVARERGPAWWRVKDADTTVYILGIPGGEIPAGLAWDRSLLERRMKGAHSLIVGTTLTARVRDVPALLRARSRMKSKTPMEETLPPELRTRFIAAREKLGKPAGRYAGWQPIVAAQFLVQDALAERRSTSVEQVVRGLARKNKVPLRSTSKYPLMPLLNAALAGLTPQVQADCMEGALEDVEAGKRRVLNAAEGWAAGDVSAALRAPRSFDRCVLALAGGAQFWRNTTRDNANDIASALGKPGHAVAVVNLRRLLAEDGVVEQLEAQGLTVIGPGEPG